jgi:carotenoid 1,2-hydratase
MARPHFDVKVPQNGYRWWYVDAQSDDGQNGLTIIGFIGSVFSPYYRRACRRGMAAPDNHCAINIALYGTKRRWAMTERGVKHMSRNAQQFTVGPSSMTCDGNGMTITIDETCMPLPFALRGSVRLTSDIFYDAPVALDDQSKHYWQAVTPHARVVVEIQKPKLKWSGFAYHDMNWGEEPLEAKFKNWTWLRANTQNGTQVLYEVERNDGSQLSFGRCFQNGIVTERNVPTRHKLHSGLWGMRREVNSESTPQLLTPLEDAPFYTRNHIAMTLDGKPCEAYHESLSLTRFANPIVQSMLPFRMPRIS